MRSAKMGRKAEHQKPRASSRPLEGEAKGCGVVSAVTNPRGGRQGPARGG